MSASSTRCGNVLPRAVENIYTFFSIVTNWLFRRFVCDTCSLFIEIGREKLRSLRKQNVKVNHRVGSCDWEQINYSSCTLFKDVSATNDVHMARACLSIIRVLKFS